MAANMLAAYYGCQYDSHNQFDSLKFAASDSFEKHINKYNVISINMQEFLSNSKTIDDMLSLLKSRLLFEVKIQYKDCVLFDETNLTFSLQDIYAQKQIPFVVLIDEWDCIFREKKDNIEEQRIYLDFLRYLLKDKVYVGLAYMTGILQI